MRFTTLFASIVSGLCMFGLLAASASPTASAAPDAQVRTHTPGNVAATATAVFYVLPSANGKVSVSVTWAVVNLRRPSKSPKASLLPKNTGARKQNRPTLRRCT